VLQPVSKSRVPAGGKWVYIDPDSGLTFSHPHYLTLKALVRQHRLTNHYPIPVNWDQAFDSNVCAQSPQACVEVTSTLTRAARFARAMGTWVMAGMPVVTPEEYQRRIDICIQCPMFGGETSIGKIACKKCGCSGLKLRMATEKCPMGKWEVK
jgi:hypothetical protein